MQLRVLLLQARHPDDPCKAEERRSFSIRTGLAEDHIVPHDLLQGPPSLREVQRYDALMVGGSGEFYVSKGDLPHFEPLLDLMGEVADVGHPTFASCFGFQCMVQALGGDIGHDPDNTEVGTFTLSLTESGQRDPLFGSLPPQFHAQMGRKDRALRMPDGVPNLASSERCPFQAFRIPEKPVWATQFHPELDHEDNRLRFMRYLEVYARDLDADQRAEVEKNFVDSPETGELLSRFLNLVFG